MNPVRPISEDDLHAYVDDALDARRRAEVAAYLDANPQIAERVSGFADQRERLRDAFAPIAREPVPPELSLARMIEVRRRRLVPGWRSVAAAAALLCAGAAGGWYGRGLVQPEEVGGLGALAEEASYSFSTFAPDRGRPVEIKAEDRAALLRWVSNRLKRPVAAPDLGAAGYRLLGGRVVATPHGPAGLFMYDDDRGSRLVMLMRPMQVKADARMAEHAKDGVGGFAWAKDGMGYSLVGEGPAASLQPLADEIRRQTEAKI